VPFTLLTAGAQAATNLKSECCSFLPVRSRSCAPAYSPSCWVRETQLCEGFRRGRVISSTVRRVLPAKINPRGGAAHVFLVLWKVAGQRACVTTNNSTGVCWTSPTILVISAAMMRACERPRWATAIKLHASETQACPREPLPPFADRGLGPQCCRPWAMRPAAFEQRARSLAISRCARSRGLLCAGRSSNPRISEINPALTRSGDNVATLSGLPDESPIHHFVRAPCPCPQPRAAPHTVLS